MARGSDAELVRRLKAGDERAFDEVYEAHRGRLFAFLGRMARRRDLAEDLLQETFVRLATHAQGLDGDTELGAWLFRVARNLFISHRRWALLDADRLREMGLWPGGRSGPASPFEETAATEAQKKLERAIAELPVAYREALLLVSVEHLEPSQAAVVAGVTPEAMRQRLARAGAMIAEKIGE